MSVKHFIKPAVLRQSLPNSIQRQKLCTSFNSIASCGRKVRSWRFDSLLYVFLVDKSSAHRPIADHTPTKSRASNKNCSEWKWEYKIGIIKHFGYGFGCFCSPFIQSQWQYVAKWLGAVEPRQWRPYYKVSCKICFKGRTGSVHKIHDVAVHVLWNTRYVYAQTAHLKEQTVQRIPEPARTFLHSCIDTGEAAGSVVTIVGFAPAASTASTRWVYCAP